MHCESIQEEMVTSGPVQTSRYLAINPKDVAAMLDELTIEVNEESFVIVLQHGGSDVT